MFILLFICGLLLFLLGLKIMTLGLERLSLPKIKKILLKFSSTPLRGAILGTVTTAIIQSSSAVTVLAIGLVNAGIMSFPQTIGVILGTNIGTTITAQIISFDIFQFSPLFIFLGAIVALLSKEPKYLHISFSLLGFGLIFFGLYLMKISVEPLRDSFLLKHILIFSNNNNFIAMLVGVILTALFQSSSVIIGITLLLVDQNMINIASAFAIILGSNIGTCITAIIAAAGSSPAAKRVAAAHLILNLAGAIFFFPFIKTISVLIHVTAADPSRQVANFHTIYNVACSLIVLPFSSGYATLLQNIIKD